MQEKYTEDIEQLDSFYQDALQQASIEPPADMWDKISASYHEQKKTRGFFHKRTTLLVVLLLLLISSAGIYYFLKNKHAENDTELNKEPQSIQQEKNSMISSPSNSTEANKKNITIQEKNIQPNTIKNGDEEIPNKVVDSVTQQTSSTVAETTAPVVAETPTTKPDTTSVKVKEIPKKKMSFREKHTQNIKSDSLRPLFIPVK